MSGTVIEDPARPDVLVYGAGAVGCLLGGLLANAGCPVTLLGRPVTGQAIRNHGLRVSLHRRQFTVQPGYIESASDVAATPDLIVLATRSFGVESAIPDLRRIAGDATTLLTVQNGVGTEDLISRAMPDIRHVAGSLTLSASFDSPGQVASTSRSGGIALAPVSPEADARWIADRFVASGIPTIIKDDFRSVKWSKLLLNVMANAVPAILGWSPGAVYRNPGMFQIERAAILEATRVIHAEGSCLVSLPGFPVPVLPWLFRLPDAISRRVLLPRIEGGRGDKMPSLLLDLDTGRHQTEASWLYRAVADAGRCLGIPTPVNRRLSRIMDAVTANPDVRAMFRDRPDRLLRNVVLGSIPVESCLFESR